jgi:hypothetical protein
MRVFSLTRRMVGQEMTEGRGPEWYRQEAARLRKRAAETTDDDIRDGYLRLAERYEELARTYEGSG